MKKVFLAHSLAERIQTARKEILDLSQRDLATRLDVSQSNVSKWESGALVPEAHHLMNLATLLEGRAESLYFLEAAGVPAEYFNGDPRYTDSSMPSEFISGAVPIPAMYQVPLLRDAAAAGTPRAIEEGQIEMMIPVLKSWAPRGSALVAFRVAGESMLPILFDSYVVVVDTAQRDPKRLTSKIVAARVGDGVTVKWLRKHGGIYMLVPQNTSARFPITVLKEDEDCGIVGAVVTWYGFPSAVKNAPPSI